MLLVENLVSFDYSKQSQDNELKTKTVYLDPYFGRFSPRYF